MRLHPSPFRIPALVVVALGASCASPGPAPEQPLRLRILQAEDARARTPGQLELLRAALADADASLRALATRALGRLERADVLEDLLGRLRDADAEVRRQAAFALAQSATSQTLDEITMPLYMALSRDPDEGVRAVAAWSLGRLPYEERADLLPDAQQVLLRAMQPAAAGHPQDGNVPPGVDDDTPANRRPGAPPSADRLVGVLRGVEALLRKQREAIEVSPELVRQVRRLALDPGTERAAEIRPLALAALSAAGALDREVAAAALTVPERESRRLAAAAAGDPALADTDPGVRLAAVRAAAERGDCDALRAALTDDAATVQLQAVDRLDVCSDAARLLAPLVDDLAAAPDWHLGAHALVTLARVAPTRAAAALEIAARHDAWQVRAYAAEAAEILGDDGVLRQLASDADPNVRSAAIPSLSRRLGHGADDLYLDALSLDDAHLSIVAAEALTGSPDPAALPALREALARLAAADLETLHDTRAAVRERIEELAGEALPAETPPASAVWIESLEQLDDLDGVEAVMTMQRGGRIVLRLLPLEAPTSALRFVRMARAGTFDGLTFHRVVGNFVIQGGSPGANEYAGHGAYTRDEIGIRSHRRGTVGISTRGRDTGDGQIFINLVDNIRLDGDYTIFAEVVEGMDVVDAVVEGDAIQSVEIRAAR